MAENCLVQNTFGKYHSEFSCLYPALGKSYTGFEKSYDTVPVYLWMKERPMIPIVAVLAYAIFCVVGRKVMANKNPWQWRKQLAVWNFSLSLFSWIGAFRTVPPLLSMLATMTVRDSICTNPKLHWGMGSTGLWAQLFCLSKFPELIDTFFIVIHKKPLIFLHWYHHITVLLYCWHSYVNDSATGLFFIAMNYSVHAIMYGYYFLMAIKMKPKWLNAKFITVAQISQMVVGVTVTLLGFYYYITQGESCSILKENVVAGFIMYGSYLFLFAQFYVARYIKVKSSVSSKNKSV